MNVKHSVDLSVDGFGEDFVAACISEKRKRGSYKYLIEEICCSKGYV